MSDQSGPGGGSFGGLLPVGQNLGACQYGSCSDDVTPEKCENFDHIQYENILTYSDITNDVKSEYKQIKTTGFEKLKKIEPTQLRDSPAPFLKSFGKNIYWKKSEPPAVTVPPVVAEEDEYDYDYEDDFPEDIFSEIGTDTT